MSKKETKEESTTKGKELAKLKIWDEKEIILHEERVIKRLTSKTIFVKLIEALNIDKGLLYTMKELTLHPGKTIKSYIDTDRVNITNPVKYFLLVIGVTIFIASLNEYYSYLNSEFMKGVGMGMKGHEMNEMNTEKSAFLTEMSNIYSSYFMNYQNLWYALSIMFSSFFSFLFFKKSGYNFVENVVVNTYIFTHSFLVFLFMVIFKLSSPVWTSIYMLIFFLYSFIVFKQVFQRAFFQTLFKTIAVSIISGVLFMLLIVGIIMVWAFNYISMNPEVIN